MKHELSLALVWGAALLAGAEAARGAEVSGNVTLASDYSFRGVSQTSRDPAIQGGLDVVWDKGLYIGTWSSNVSFDNTSQELDLYVGYSGQIGDAASFDLRYTRLEYPSAGSELDCSEFGASITFANVTVGVAYSNEYFGLNSVSWVYPHLGYTVPMRWDTALNFHVGMSLVDDNSASDWTAAFGDEEVLDWSVIWTIPLRGVEVGIALVGTDVDDDFCGADCDTRAVVSLSKSL